MYDVYLPEMGSLMNCERSPSTSKIQRSAGFSAGLALPERPANESMGRLGIVTAALSGTVIVIESLGMADVVAKSTGSSNPYNMVRATMDALKKQTSPRMVANRRGKKVSDVLRRGGDEPAVAE